MNEIELFDNGEFQLDIRPDGDSFRVRATGLANALGFRQALDLLRSIPDEEKGYELVRTSSDQRVSYVTEAGFYRALGQRQVARITDETTRELVKRFQDWVYREVLPKIRKQGGYISPVATTDQLIILADRAASQARVLRLLDGIVDPAWLEAKARHVAARALGEEPEVDPATRPLTVGEYLEENGIRGKAQRSLAPAFGKSLKRLYQTKYGKPPMDVDRFIDGAIRKVAGYTEAHRPLFDQVWADMNERKAS